MHTTTHDTVEALQAVIGTTSGTSVLKNFSQGDFAVRINSSNVLQQNLQGTINNSILGTPSITGGIINSIVMGTPSITGGTATSQINSSPTYIGNIDGWISAGETWVYASTDDPTFTFTIAGVDLTTKYYPGMRIKLTQTTAKYFIITKVAFSTDTTITIYGGTDYDLANAAITSPYYSLMKAPAGFPLDPTKWMIEITDITQRSQSSPSTATWYNIGTTNSQISIPIGIWFVDYKVYVYGNINAAAAAANHEVAATLSTANNSESNSDYTAAGFINSIDLISWVVTCQRSNLPITVTSKTTYYLNGLFTSTAAYDSLIFYNDRYKMIIRAVSAYL
jgi:hypothetical protein